MRLFAQLKRRLNMTQFVQNGERVDYTNGGSSAIEYNAIVAGADKVFVAAEKIEAGATGAVYAEGVFEFTTADTDAIAFGQKMYYNADDGITATASVTEGEEQSAVTTPNIFVGYAVQAIGASAGKKSILIKL